MGAWRKWALRVIGGKAKGRKLAALRGRRVRPTSDKVREALFDLLGDTVRGARVLDVFAGSGGVGIEALSRGARSVVFVEKEAAAARVLRKNIEACGITGQADLRIGDVRGQFRRLRRETEPFDLVFLDPPYRSPIGARTVEETVRWVPLTVCARVVIEHAAEDAPKVPAGWTVEKRRRYGDTALTFFRPGSEGTKQ